MFSISGVSNLKARYYKSASLGTGKYSESRESQQFPQETSQTCVILTFKRHSWKVAIATPSIYQRCGDSALPNGTCASFVSEKKIQTYNIKDLSITYFIL
jgi:hypothetical protein